LDELNRRLATRGPFLFRVWSEKAICAIGGKE